MLGIFTIEQANKYCKDDIKEIEGYYEAITSEKRYCCHHKFGIDVQREELIEKGLYYKRPADELIFLELQEHTRLHNKGEKHPMYGKHHTDEVKQKMSYIKKGKNNPLAKQCTINGVIYGCLKDAYKAIKPNYTYMTFTNKYKRGEL